MSWLLLSGALFGVLLVLGAAVLVLGQDPKNTRSRRARARVFATVAGLTVAVVGARVTATLTS